MIPSQRLSRRQVLRAGVAALMALPLAGAGAPSRALAAPRLSATALRPSAFDWKRFQGASIYAAFPSAPYTAVVQKLVPSFEEMTGIKVQYEQVPEQQIRQKLVVEMTGKSSAIDVFGSSLHVEKFLFSRAGWYEPLNSYLADPDLTNPDFAWDDVTTTGKEWVTTADGTIIALPESLGLFALFYRRDLFEAAGLKAPPATLDELEAAVKALHHPPEVYGFVGRGLKNANVPLWGMFFMAMGGRYLDDQNRLLTTSPEAIESARMYARLMREYAPPGVVGFNWNESQSVFMQGQAAIWPDGLNFVAPVEDPTKSKVVGKVGYALFPGTERQKPFAGSASGGVAINAYSKNKQAAWYFAQWASGPEVALRQVVDGGAVLPRASIYQSEEFKQNNKFPQSWVDAVVGSLESSLPQLPQIPPVTQFRDTFGVALTSAIEGGDVEALLKQATEEFAPVLQKSLEQ